MKQYIGISRDHSGSMYHIGSAAARDYNDNVATIRDAARSNGIETIVSVVECGYGHTRDVRRVIENAPVSSLRPIIESQYSTRGSGTPLFDSVGELIEMFEQIDATASTDSPYDSMGKEELRQACRDAGISYSKLNNAGMRDALKAKHPLANNDISFLVMAVTDGEENASRRYSARTIAEKIRKLQATDRWTFVFRVPRGYSRSLVSMGIPVGNILEWDQTEQGVAVATAATRQAFDNYYTKRASGVRSTKSFYADLSDVSAKDVKKSLKDISSEVLLWPVSEKDDGKEIRHFVEKRTGETFVKGTAFYQLVKAEREVQDYKKLVIRDKNSNAIYEGVAARQMLGLPTYGTISLRPDDLGQFDLFIQSTSVNRKLNKGTQVLYWRGAVR